MPPTILSDYTKVRRYSAASSLFRARAISAEESESYVKILEVGSSNEAILFDLASKYTTQKSSTPKSFAERKPAFFSLSRIVIPENTQLLATPVIMNSKGRRASLKKIINNVVDLTDNAKLYLDFVYNFSTVEEHLHPCHVEINGATFSTFGLAKTVVEADRPLHQGMKACAYTIYTVNPTTLQPNFLGFRQMNVPSFFVGELEKLYNSLPPVGKKFGANPDWSSVIMIPLELPSTQVCYYLIPISHSKNELTKWLDIARNNAVHNQGLGRDPKSSVKIDYCLEHIDGWEGFYSLDAEIIKEI